MKQEQPKYTPTQLRKRLNKKMKAFCSHYISDWNAAKAARLAGYSKRSAREQGFKLLTKVHIQQYIELIKNDIEKECGISKMGQINELKKIAYSSMALLNESWIERKSLEELKQNSLDLVDCIQEISTKTESYFDKDKNKIIDVEYVKIKLYDKLRAIEIINKMMGYNEPEKHDVSVDTTHTITIVNNDKDIKLS